MPNDIYGADATELATLVRTGEVSPRELVEAAIAGIEETDPALNFMVHRRFEEALADADGPLPDGPLRGVPTVLKDLGQNLMTGQPSYAGSAVIRDLGVIADHDSNVTRKLLDAGLVVLGRTNVPEFGPTVTTEPVAFGPTLNPWDTSRSPGGSSGGSAAAVASGSVPLGHGGDAGGSIRIPASMTGLVGLKSSRGRMSMGPDQGEEPAGFAVEGAITRTVRDAATIVDVLAGCEPGDPYTAPTPVRPFAAEVGVTPGRLRIGVTTGLGDFETDPACALAATQVGVLLAELGHDVDASTPAPMQTQRSELMPYFFGTLSALFAATMMELEGNLGQPLDLNRFEPLTRDHIETGRRMSAADAVRSRLVLNRFTRAMATWWSDDGWDLLVTPMMPVPPFLLGSLDFDPADRERSHDRIYAATQYSVPFNVTGQPAISLPLHWTPDGLPVGVQLVAAYGREDLLVRVASQLEEAAPWAHRRPPVFAGASVS
ncbi:amidase [Actinomadura coerulea]|uniref:amidase n=1 Tax=Actinomadura coerulea TaxID=46159 RepID=UPI003441D2FD